MALVQVKCIFPLPILQQIIHFCGRREQLSFRATCKWAKEIVERNITFGYPWIFVAKILRKHEGPRNLVGKLISRLRKRSYSQSIRVVASVFDAVDRALYVSVTKPNCIYRFSIDCTHFTRIDVNSSLYKNLILDSLAFDSKRKILYGADSNCHMIMRIDLRTCIFDIISGCYMKGREVDGPYDLSRVHSPKSLVYESETHCLYFTTLFSRIRKLDLTTLYTMTLCGNGKRGSQDGGFNAATFDLPQNLCLDHYRRALYVTDFNNDRIRKICLKTETVTTLQLNWDGNQSLGITAMYYDLCNDYLFVQCANRTTFIIKIDNTQSERIIRSHDLSYIIKNNGSTNHFEEEQCIHYDPFQSTLYFTNHGSQRIDLIYL